MALVGQRLVAASPGAEVFEIGPVEDGYLEQLARPRATAALSFAFDGVTPGDPWSWALVTRILAPTTLLACWRPAHQAARVDPVTLLREE